MSAKKNTWSSIKYLSTTILFSFIISACTPKSPGLHIEVDTIFANIHANTFHASGPAVAKGIFCPTGEVDETEGIGQAPPEGTPTYEIHTHKVFLCNDESGIIEMELNLVVYRDQNVTEGTWVIIRGEGAYSNLHGSGSIIGQNGDSTHIYDTYDGFVQ